MDCDKVNSVLNGYAEVFRILGFEPKRRQANAPLSTVDPTRFAHLMWMCMVAVSFPPEKIEKKMRWLGFIQGALWGTGLLTVEAAKLANKPEGEEYCP